MIYFNEVRISFQNRSINKPHNREINGILLIYRLCMQGLGKKDELKNIKQNYLSI